MPRFAVTGATGPFGRHAVESLLERGVPAGDVVALGRAPLSRLQDLADRGVVVREADYDRPETLTEALAGVDRLLLVSGNAVGQRVPQHTAVIEAARDAGVELLVYTSILNAGSTQNPLAPEHEATEAVLRESGVPAAVVRNGWYLENYTGQLASYLEHGAVLAATGGARFAPALRSELAEAAAVVLLEGSAGDVHELTGRSITVDELAAAVTEATGTTVVARDVSEEDLVAALQGAGLDAGTAGFVASLDGSIARGELDGDGSALGALLGRTPTGAADAFRAVAG